MSWFGRKSEPAARELTHPRELQLGDMISFKDLPPVPTDLQGKDLEVTRIGGYQYSDEVVTEFTLTSATHDVVQLSVDEHDGDPRLSLSRTIPRQQVLKLFDEQAFGELWSEEYINLPIRADVDDLHSWYAPCYQQQSIEAVAFYYKRDLRISPPSDYGGEGEGEGDEMRYYEAISDDELYGLSVEVYDGGDTDVSLQVYIPLRMVSDLWALKA